MKKVWLVIAAVVITLLALVSVACCTALSPTTVSGEVSCDNNREVVGVYVEVAEMSLYGDGQANIWPVGGNFRTAQYSKVINGDAYQLHVGCGGRPHNWGSDNRSNWLKGSGHQLVCTTQKANFLGVCSTK